MSAKFEVNRRLLIVDDEPDIVQSYVDFLSTVKAAPKKSSRSAAAEVAQDPEDSQAYEIITANSGEQALEIVRKLKTEGKSIAGGFFDVKMEPGMDGIRTIQEIWKEDPQMHCTIVTAYQDRSVQDIHQIFGTRFKDQWDYLNKPFLQGEIVQKARQMLASWNRRRGLEIAIEQLKLTQQQLVQAEKMSAIGQIARGMAHEFGNILQRIVGKADLSLAEEDLGKVKENIKVVLEASDRAARIIRNLQSFSKISADRTKTQIKSVIDVVLSFVGHDLKKANVNLDLKVSPTKSVLINAQEIEQVLLNLIINAIHAMPKGGNLEVGCANEDGSVVVWLKDSGIGIPPDVLPRIFEYAFTTKGDSGSGLGLSISKKIIESHGGKIDVRTEVGKGTEFKIYLPESK
ncbi:MAG: ATP-binding protein [Bacteriovoracia bacterium]